MNKDIRLAVTFPSHPKIQRLIKRLGLEGVWSLIILYCYVAQNKPDGRLSGMDCEDIAIAAKWEKSAKRFVNALLQLRLLDRGDDDVLSIHDWAEHNPYAYHAKERSERARKAASQKWRGRGEENANSIAEQCSEHEQAMLDEAGSNAPYPYPSPSPSPSPEHTPSPDVYERFERFWAAYPKKCKKAQAEEVFRFINPSEELLATMLAAIERAKRSNDWKNESGQFIPFPAKWLTDKRWEDEITSDPDGYDAHAVCIVNDVETSGQRIR